MTFPMDLNKFNATLAQLRQSEGVSVKEETSQSGKIETGDVIMSYFWDGTTVALNVFKRKSLKAKLASDQQIFNRVSGLLA